MSQSVTKNIIAKGALDIFNALLPILITPYVYRVLGRANMGSIEYTVTLFSYFSMLGMLGIYNYGLRGISSNRNDFGKVRYIYKNLFTIGLFSNLFFLNIYILFLLFVVKDPVIKTLGLIYSGNLAAQLFYVEWVNEGFEEFKFITIKTIIIRLLSVIAIFLFVRNSSDAMVYVVIQTGICITNNLISFFFVQRKIRLNFRETFTGLQPKNFIGPLFIILILRNTGILYTVVDRTMLGYFTGTDNVALFSIGQKIVEICKTLVLSIVFATLPRLAIYLKEDKVLYQKGLIKLIRLVIALVFPIGIGLFMLSSDVIWLFGGDQYLGGTSAMRIFSLRIIFLCIESIIYNQVLFLHGKEKIILKYNIICGFLNVAFNFCLLNYLTPATAILTTLLSEIIFEILMLLYIKRNIAFSLGLLKKYNIKYILLSFAFVPIILIIKSFDFNRLWFIFLSIISCSLFYTIILYKTKDGIMIEVLKRFNLIR